MNTPELNLQQRLAAIVETAYVNPFSKVASSDEQLSLIADSLVNADQATAAPAPVQPKAPRAMTLSDIMKQASFQKGFASVYNERKQEIEEALSKVAGISDYAESAGRYARRLGTAARAVGNEVRKGSDRAKTYGAIAAAGGVSGALRGAYKTRKANKALPDDQKKSVLMGAAKGAVKGGASGAVGSMAADVLMRSQLRKVT